MIYLDSAATALRRPPQVCEAMCRAMESLGNAGRGAHRPTLDAARTLYETRVRLAQLFHAEAPECMAFCANATQALNTAVSGLLTPEDHVITTACEHNSVLRPLYRMQEQGMGLTILPTDRMGHIAYDQLEDCVRPNTRAIVAGHASNVTGMLTDMAAIARFARRHHLLLIVDAAQTAGVIPIDVSKMGADVLCFTGHKGLMGPQGTGGLYVRPGLNIASFAVGGSGVHSYDRRHPLDMPTVLEAGTQNAHGIAGLGAAVQWLLDTGVESVQRWEHGLTQRLADGLRGIPGVTLYGDWEHCERTGIVTWNLRDMDSGQISDWLWEDAEICSRAGAHCAPLMHEALGTREQGAIRFSISYFNTEKEIDCAVQAVRALAE